MSCFHLYCPVGKVLADNECHVIGDINLDYLKWNAPEAGQKKIVENTKFEIDSRLLPTGGGAHQSVARSG